MLTDRPRGIFARDVSSTREFRKCLYRMPSATTQEQRPTRFESHTQPSAREYSVFGPRARNELYGSVSSILRGMTGGLNAFGEVATVRITRHPFCKLSTPPARSLSLSLWLSLCPSLRLFSSVLLCLFLPLPFSPREDIIAPETKRAKSLALIS